MSEVLMCAYCGEPEPFHVGDCDRPRDQPTGIESEVCADIAERQRIGLAKYGVTVADNPLTLKQWLQHAYEECLDQAVYLKRAMKELQ